MFIFKAFIIYKSCLFIYSKLSSRLYIFKVKERRNSISVLSDEGVCIHMNSKKIYNRSNVNIKTVRAIVMIRNVQKNKKTEDVYRWHANFMSKS